MGDAAEVQEGHPPGNVSEEVERLLGLDDEGGVGYDVEKGTPRHVLHDKHREVVLRKQASQGSLGHWGMRDGHWGTEVRGPINRLGANEVIEPLMRCNSPPGTWHRSWSRCWGA